MARYATLLRAAMFYIEIISGHCATSRLRHFRLLIERGILRLPRRLLLQDTLLSLTVMPIIACHHHSQHTMKQSLVATRERYLIHQTSPKQFILH